MVEQMARDHSGDVEKSDARQRCAKAPNPALLLGIPGPARLGLTCATA